jgi:hypothetical protein
MARVQGGGLRVTHAYVLRVSSALHEPLHFRCTDLITDHCTDLWMMPKRHRDVSSVSYSVCLC